MKFALTILFLFAIGCNPPRVDYKSGQNKHQTPHGPPNNQTQSDESVDPVDPNVEIRRMRTQADNVLRRMPSGTILVTKAKYLRLQNGMSYRDAVRIIGLEGEEMSRNITPAMPGYPTGIETVMYMWQNPSGSNMNAMFQNDKLMQKSQFGLSD